MPRPFSETLNALRYGKCAEDLAEALSAVVTACGDRGGKGELTLKLSIKSGKAGQMEIFDDIKMKLPAAERGSTLLFATPEGNLQRNDPRQRELEGLRTVPATNTEPKEVNNG